MAKTKKTLEIEKQLLSKWEMGIFNCPEVMIGDEGIVDILRYQKSNNSRGELWTCIEIKVSVADFNSKQKKTFVGNLNYYAIPAELYPKVKDKIPEEIGVMTFPASRNCRSATYQELKVDKTLLFYSMMRSMSRVNHEYLMKKYFDVDQSNKQVITLKEKNDELKKELKHIDKCQNYAFEGLFLELIAKIDLFEKTKKANKVDADWHPRWCCVYFPKDELTYKCHIDDYLISKNKKQLMCTVVDVYNKTDQLLGDDKINALNNLESKEFIFDLKDADKEKFFFSLYECSGYIIRKKIEIK